MFSLQYSSSNINVKSKTCCTCLVLYHKVIICIFSEFFKVFEKEFFAHFYKLKTYRNPRMNLNLNLIAAACDGMGIGVKGTLPWKLKTEMAFFTSMTSNTKHPDKKNVVLMGRRTWECIPKKYRPLQNRINIVLSSQFLDYGKDAIVCKNIPHALDIIGKPPLKDQVESIWVIGGSSVYKAAMESPNFHRLYLTKIKKHFDCDTFFPAIPNNIVLTNDPNIPQGVQEEDGIQFVYEVYEKN